MTPESVLLIFVALFGLCFGSFYNVVILRGLSNESIVFPASKCPKCETPLKWWHNIPVISYLFLRGKCAFCKCKISWQYPLVELITMLLFIASYLKWGFDIKALAAAGFLSLFLITAVTDLKERVILTQHAYTLTGFGVAYSIYQLCQTGSFVWSLENPLLSSLLGLVIGVAVMELMAYTGYIFAKQRAFGEGDSYITGALGAIFGWKLILPILLFGAIIQLSVSVPMYLYNLFKNNKATQAIELILFLGLSAGMWFWGSLLGDLIYYCGLLLLILIAIHLIRTLVNDIKTPSGQTLLPYVPALVIAATIGLFLWF